MISVQAQSSSAMVSKVKDVFECSLSCIFFSRRKLLEKLYALQWGVSTAVSGGSGRAQNCTRSFCEDGSNTQG